MAPAAAMLLVLLTQGGNATTLWRLQHHPMSIAHSHNDYEQEHPLDDALRYGFPSVEADVWWSGNEVVVSHLPWWNRGRLEDLYLRPLQERVDRLGSVYGDGQPFYLWIDLKQSGRELTDALRSLLDRYPMLATFTDSGIRPGPVVAVLTGDMEAKARMTDNYPVRRACRDSNRLSAQDPPADLRWSWYALRWGDIVDWDGNGAIPEVARGRLQDVVRMIHGEGRRLRFYEVPEHRAAWAAAISAGVDLVSTDRLSELHDFLVLPTLVLAGTATTRP